MNSELKKNGKKVIREVDNIRKVADKATDIPPIKQAKNFWYGLGPGLTTGAADDDPSGIATYSQAGAKYGFQLLFLSIITYPLMAVVQEMCARIGLQTGRGLAGNIRMHFPKWVIVFVALLVLIANSFNIGADLGALAKVTQLLYPNSNYALLIIFFALICLFFQIFFSYEKYAKYLKYLASLLVVYIITAFVIPNFPWKEVLHSTFSPSINFSKEQIILICGIFGTTISPYLFFWQTSQEVEEKISSGMNRQEIAKRVVSSKELKKTRIDVWSGMFLSNIVMFFIIAVCGATLFPEGINNITTASEAASALEPLAGSNAKLLFALGIFAVGLLGIPVLAGSASYAVSECFGWREGLNKKFLEAKYFYGVIIFSMLIGLLINFTGLDSIKALIYAAVFNGLISPIILLFIVLLAGNKKIMGNLTNSTFSNIVGWVAIILMLVVGIATIIAFF